MDTLLGVFIAVTALAVILQMLILAGMYRHLQALSREFRKLSADFDEKVTPVLSGIRAVVSDSQRGISSILANAADISQRARDQVIRFDSVMADAADRLRLQIIRVDQMLSVALGRIEETGTTVRQNVLAPIREASALIHGVKTGLDFILSRRKSSPVERAQQHQDEELFI
ncbi:MAG TPA: hypothetical protein VIH17_04640 [Candidatus Acidoferrales bacterium]